MEEMLEIRWHGREGQAQTAALLLGKRWADRQVYASFSRLRPGTDGSAHAGL